MLEVLHVRLQNITEEQVNTARFRYTDKMFSVSSSPVPPTLGCPQSSICNFPTHIYKHAVPIDCVLRWEWQQDRRCWSWLLSTSRLLSVHLWTSLFLMTGTFRNYINLWIFFQLHLALCPSHFDFTLHELPISWGHFGLVIVLCVQLDLWDVDGARIRPHCSWADYGDGDGEACCHGALCGQERVHDQRRDDKGGNQSTAGGKSQTLGGHAMFVFCFFYSILVQYWFGQSFPYLQF